MPEKHVDEPPEAERVRARRLPGFINEQDTGLGDVIARASTHFGIRPCEGCKRRAATLNRWLPLGNQPPSP